VPHKNKCLTAVIHGSTLSLTPPSRKQSHEAVTFIDVVLCSFSYRFPGCVFV
jgi:hypothetical protein